MHIDRQGNKHRSAEEWAEILGQFQSSGLGLAEFCDKEGLHRGTLRKWQKRLGGDEQPQSEFVEVSTPSFLRASTVEIVFKSGLVLRIEG